MIDTHIHVVPTNLPGLKPIPADVERLMEAPPDAMAARVVVDMRKAGVTAAFGMGALGGPKDDPLGINGTIRLASLVPGLRAIGVADPTRIDDAHIKAVEDQIVRDRRHLVAFKAYLGYLHFGPEHPNYAPYYRLAAKYDLPVIFHTCDNWSTRAKVKYAHPLLVDEVAVDHPENKFVMAHLGNPWLLDAAEVIYKNDNVLADLSGLIVGDAKVFAELLGAAAPPDAAAGLAIADLKKAIWYAERPDRFLYGTDWPLAPMDDYRKFIESIIPAEHREAVFRKNAEALFGIDASPPAAGKS